MKIINRFVKPCLMAELDGVLRVEVTPIEVVVCSWVLSAILCVGVDVEGELGVVVDE